jgi:hypothetical protein
MTKDHMLLAVGLGLLVYLFNKAKTPALASNGAQQWASTYSGPVGPVYDQQSGTVTMAPLGSDWPSMQLTWAKASRDPVVVN